MDPKKKDTACNTAEEIILCYHKWILKSSTLLIHEWPKNQKESCATWIQKVFHIATNDFSPTMVPKKNHTARNTAEESIAYYHKYTHLPHFSLTNGPKKKNPSETWMQKVFRVAKNE